MSKKIEEFFRSKVPKTWFVSEPVIEVDGDEILYVGVLSIGASAESFRNSTRADRMAIAQEGENQFGRKVSWGVEIDGSRTLFSTLGMPVMTRLRLKERAVLDTLVTAGVARSRSEALAWCVKLTGQHEVEWLEDLKAALVDVEKVKSQGPTLV